jgi:hypothetical protein
MRGTHQGMREQQGNFFGFAQRFFSASEIFLSDPAAPS